MVAVLLTVLASTVDCFAACLALGAGGVLLPWRCAAALGMISGGITAGALAGANRAVVFLSPTAVRWGGFAVLAILGIANLFGERIRGEMRRRRSGSKRSSLLLRICEDETAADSDRSNILSMRETVLFAIPVSADLVWVSFAASGSGAGNAFFVLAMAVASTVFGKIGNITGMKLRKKIPVNLSRFTGILFLILAVLALF